MEPESCPNCGTWVVRKADGSCPACLSDFAASSDSHAAGQSENPGAQSPVCQGSALSEPRGRDSGAAGLKSTRVALRIFVVLFAAAVFGAILLFRGPRLREPEVLGRLIDGAIPLLMGGYAILLGSRIVGPKRGVSERFDNWHARYGSTMLLLGPALCFFGLYRSFSASPSPQFDWQRYATSDGVCTAEFPAPPVRDKQTAGGVESTRLTLRVPGTGNYYMLTFSDVPPDAPPSTDDEKFDAMPDNIRMMGQQTGDPYDLLHTEKVVENGIAGREFEFSAGGSHILR